MTLSPDCVWGAFHLNLAPEFEGWVGVSSFIQRQGETSTSRYAEWWIAGSNCRLITEEGGEMGWEVGSLHDGGQDFASVIQFLT